MRDEVHSKNPKDTLEENMPYPKHYDISKDETQVGKADARREAYEGDCEKQDYSAMPDM